MSVDVEGTCDVWQNRWQVARKPHRCDACDETIRVGNRYHYHFQIYERDRDTVKRCARCQAIYEHLDERMSHNCGEEKPDERLNCGHEYRERWEEEPPLEVQMLAFALPGEVKL